MGMSVPKYVVIDLGETFIYCPWEKKEEIFECCRRSGMIELTDISGKEVIIDFQTRTCCYTSTPEQRATMYILNKEGDAEKKQLLQDAGFSDFDD